MTLAEALRGLYARIPLGARLGLEPMRAACARFGHPQRAFEVVHVAGTNGKGSTSSMTEAALRAAGRRAGLYTSPHVCRFAERIRLDGAALDDTSLAALLGEVLRREPDLSFFETATLAALHAFREAGVEVAVLEVGLGGRLDATNVVPTPRAAAITRIALDHTDRLGDTLELIAREKAGILKAGGRAFHGPVTPEVLRVLSEVAAEVGANLTAAPDVDVRPALPGAHQIDNARVAYALARELGASDAACQSGIASATWPARLETVVTPEGPVLLDAAHNPDGAEALALHLAADPRPVALVFGCLGDKKWREMIDRLAPRAAHRIYLPPPSGVGRSPVPGELLAARHAGEVAATLPDALRAAREAVGSSGLVVITGSIFLAGAARAHLLQLPEDPPVAL